MQARIGRFETARKLLARHVPAALLVALLTVTCATSARAAETFGQPPSGEIPILYNDHHVYAKPDVLRTDRVLAALVKGGQIYVPLRSMFEAMGATVTASADGKTVTAAKPGASVSVTLGKNIVVVNGEERPLDVAPILYRGVVLVPVRVLSEALGAYVQWVPERRVVVVRYIAAIVPAPVATPTPVPTAVPTSAPIIVPPTPSPTPVPPASYRAFVQAAITSRKNYNEFSAGGDCPESYLLNAGYAFKDSPLAVKARLPPRRVRHERQPYRLAAEPLHALCDDRQRNRAHARVPRAAEQLRRAAGVPGRGAADLRRRGLSPHLEQLRLSRSSTPSASASKSFRICGPGSISPAPRSTIRARAGNYTITDPASVNAGKSYQQHIGIVKYDVGARARLRALADLRPCRLRRRPVHREAERPDRSDA